MVPAGGATRSSGAGVSQQQPRLTGPLTANLPQLRGAVEAEFGAAFAAAKSPSASRFAEEVRASGKLTGTASVSHVRHRVHPNINR